MLSLTKTRLIIPPNLVSVDDCLLNIRDNCWIWLVRSSEVGPVDFDILRFIHYLIDFCLSFLIDLKHYNPYERKNVLPLKFELTSPILP